MCTSAGPVAIAVGTVSVAVWSSSFSETVAFCAVAPVPIVTS